MPIMYQLGKAIQCPNCNGISRLQNHILGDSFPVALQCPHCKQAFTLTGFIPIPKYDPEKIEKDCYYKMLTNIPEEYLERPNDLFTPRTVPNLNDLIQNADQYEYDFASLQKAGKVMSDSIAQIFCVANQIQHDLNQFKLQIGQHFLMKWRQATRFKQYWREEFLDAFLDWPIMSFPVSCNEKHCESYARWILMPKFFSKQFGVSLPVAGGFQLQLSNQFTRLSFPLEREEAQAIQCQPTYDLQVIGNKIIGPSLPFLWKDIPGIAEDKDSNAQWVSVCIQDNESARSWLADHSIRPWEPKEIQTKDMAYQNIPEDIYDRAEYLTAWETFRSTGRVGIFWPDLSEARYCASLLASMIRGIKCIFVSSRSDENYYNKIKSVAMSAHGDADAGLNHWVILKNGASFRWDRFMNSHVAIVDVSNGGIDDDIISNLYNYQGKVIVVSNEFVFDFHESNITAPRIYGLAGFPVFPSEIISQVSSGNKDGIQAGKSSYVSLLASLKNSLGMATYDDLKSLFYKGFSGQIEI